jgi:hypothetical protein
MRPKESYPSSKAHGDRPQKEVPLSTCLPLPTADHRVCRLQVIGMPGSNASCYDGNAYIVASD